MTTQLYHGMYRCTVWFSVIICEELSSPEQREHTFTCSSSARKTDQNEKKDIERKREKTIGQRKERGNGQVDERETAQARQGE